MYRPTKGKQMTTPVQIQVPQTVSENLGVRTIEYADLPYVTFCNWASYGGTERDVNGVISVEKTATLTAWYDPNIKSDCRVVRLQDGKVFEVLGEPEDIELRHQYVVFKVRMIDANP